MRRMFARKCLKILKTEEKCILKHRGSLIYAIFIDTRVPMLVHFVFRFSMLLLSVWLTFHRFWHRQNWLKLDGCNTKKDKQGESLDVFSAW